MAGGYINISKEIIKNIPLPQQTDDSIGILTEKIQLSKKTNTQYNTISLESHINQLVYKLYDLTDIEVSIIENIVK